MKILISIIGFIAVLIILKAIGLLLRQAVKKYTKWKLLSRYFPLIEFVIILITIFAVIEYLFISSDFYNYIILLLILITVGFLSWYFVRDFIAGVIFRTQNSFREGDYVKLGEIKGRIRKIRPIHISIDTKDESTVKIPYTRLINEIVSEKSGSVGSEDSKITLRAIKKDNITVTSENIYKALLNSPWRIKYSPPYVTFIKEENDFYYFEIRIKTLNLSHLGNISSSLNSKFGFND